MVLDGDDAGGGDVAARAPPRARPAVARLAGRPAPLRPGDTGAGSSARRLDELLERLDLAIDVLDRGGARRSSSGSARLGGGAGRRRRGTELRRRRGRGRARSPRTASGCRASCSWPSPPTSGSSSCSRRYGREIRTLADVPDEELDRARETRGHRPVADRAVAAVAGLGGDQAPARRPRRGRLGLRDRRLPDRRRPRRRGRLRASSAAAPGPRGIRIAADMVPNHMGIDSRWVVEHPGALHVRSTSRPSRRTRSAGPNLSERPARRDHARGPLLGRHGRGRRLPRAATRPSGEQRFIYHGNDGTSFPWNDTAQLDYLKADVREAVIRTILDVARRSPIIRFDAAMVLARKHVRRLWYPEPGAGGAIPSRAEHAIVERGVQPADAARSSGARSSTGSPPRRPGRSSSPRRSGCSRATSSGPSACTGSTTRRSCTCSATRTTRATARSCATRSSSTRRPRAVRELPDEPRREARGGAVRHRRQVVLAATLLATLPGLPMLGHGQVEGWRERYGHGVPAGPLERAGRPGPRRPLRARDRAAPPPRGGVLRARPTSTCTTRRRTAAASSRTSTPSRTARAPSGR